MSPSESTSTQSSRPAGSGATLSMIASLGVAVAAVGIYLLVRRTRAAESVDHLLDACERAVQALEDRLEVQTA